MIIVFHKTHITAIQSYYISINIYTMPYSIGHRSVNDHKWHHRELH